nr:hypothetical protein [Tanacetum cinerariifolium]
MLHVLRVEMVINSPWMLSNNWLVQKQTAFGKDTSNPFMADNLPKIKMLLRMLFIWLLHNLHLMAFYLPLKNHLHLLTNHPVHLNHKMQKDEGIELVTDQEKDAEVEGRHADKQAELYNLDLDHSSKVLSMQKDDTEVQEAVEIVTTAKLMTEVVTAAATQVVAASTPIPAVKPKILNIAAAPAVLTRRRKGVEIIKSINETPAQKAAKRRKLSEEAQEAEDLRKRLEIG